MLNSLSLFDRAKKVMPGGVNSPVRAFRAVGGEPVFIRRAAGCFLFDNDGKRYIDYIGSWGPMILGHGDPDVLEAVLVSVNNGSSFGTPSPQEVELAEIIVDSVPSIEMVRMVNSGTEATMSVIRLARASTGREKIIKFDGCYHGHADSFLIAAGSGVATFGTPDSPGVTRGAARDTLTAVYNDLDSVERLFLQNPDEIACVIVEPVAGNMGVVPPVEGFLRGLRDLCDTYHTLLVFDEVMTGFRVSRGGAQELYGIKPDLTTLGKIIGGGFPAGAYGGRGDLMRMIAPEGTVYQAGTLAGNPVAMTAGLETIRKLLPETYQQLEKRAAMLEDGLNRIFHETSINHVIQRAGSMITLFFAKSPIRNFSDAKAADHPMYAAFFRSMMKRGFHLPPSGYEAWFISLAHSEEIIEQTLSAVSEAAREISR